MNRQAIRNFGSQILNGDTTIFKVLRIILIIVAVIAVYILFVRYFQRFVDRSKMDIPLFAKTKSGRKVMVLQQDKSQPDAVPVTRSKNQPQGVEFSYSLWMYIEDLDYNHGKIRPILMKGSESGWPNQAPAIYINANNNLQFTVNTLKTPYNKLEVSNIPVNKWIHLVLSVGHKTMRVFVNGNLVKQLQLDDYPKQNEGDIYLNPRGGFSGYISRVWYHAYALDARQILTELRHGPAKVPCVDTKEMPPY